MTLITECLDGLVRSASVYPIERPVDFILRGPFGVLVAYGDWWTMEWGQGAVVFMLGELAPLHGSVVGKSMDGPWTLYRSNTDSPDDIWVRFMVPEDEALAAATKAARERVRLNWDAYAAQIEALKEVMGPDWTAQIDEWVQAAKTWPNLGDPPPPGLRQVGIVTVEDQTGLIVDALVIDEAGLAGTARGNGWLESIGSQWMAFSAADRPDLVEFLAWVADQSPHDGLSPGRPVETLAEGTVEDIAFRLLPSTV